MINDPGVAIPAEILGGLNDFVARARASNLDSNDRRLHPEHPLVKVVDAVLEAVTASLLRRPVVGINRPNQRRLTLERRALKDADSSPKLDNFLFTFDEIIQIVLTSGYLSRTAEEECRFFAELIPEWLAALEECCKEAGQPALAEAAARAATDYSEIAFTVVQS